MADNQELIDHINAQLQPEGLRLANDEAGWYYNVLDLSGEVITVWCTDLPAEIEEIE